MRKLIILLLLVPFTFLNSYAGVGNNFSFSGYLKNETSLGMKALNEVPKFKNIASLSGEYTLNDQFAVFTSGRYWYDAAYSWRDKYDKAQALMQHVQRTDWLRDCYLDYTSDKLDMRLGKQQVAWGQADGITILDRVNPFDLSEYWLQDMVDLRIPLWMANVKYSPKLNSTLQLLVVPDFEQSTAAPPGAPLTFRSYTLYDSWKKGKNVVEDIQYPAKKFENSTFGVQWSDRIGDLDYTFNYLHGYYYSASTYTRLYNPAGNRYSFLREFKQWNMYGTSFNKTFTNPGPMKGITLRGDFAYYNREPVYYGVDGSSLGYHLWDNVFWLLGVDKYIATGWLASFQFAQYIMEDAKPGVTNRGVPQITLNRYTYGPADQIENIFSFKLTKSFMHDRMKPEFFWTGTDDNQGRISPKVTYEIKDNLWLTVGAHYFYGKVQDTNGQFRESSQVFMNVKYAF
jgi:hypothetical protein